MTVNNQHDIEMDEMALARFTLGIAKSTSVAVGPEPDDAELAAFYENQIDDVRRPQIISHIANNNLVYQRWISFIDALSYLDEIEDEAISADISSTDQITITKKIKEFFMSKNIGIFGGGFVTASIALFIIFVLPIKDVVNISQGLDDAYVDWGTGLSSDWAQAPDSVKPQPETGKTFSKSRGGSFNPVVKSYVRKIIETGFKDGTAKISGYPYSAFKIKPDLLTSITENQLTSAQAESYTLFYNTGRLAAITSIQCTLDRNNERVIGLHAISSAIVNGLQITSVLETNPIVSGFSVTEDHAAAVCNLSANILNYLQSKE